jgi:hypothetical protein
MGSTSAPGNLGDFKTSTDTGERVLDHAVALAKLAFGERLIAAYALGSLAHGGFSVHVSDVDVGLVLADPLVADDENRVEQLRAAVNSAGAPLADRLSLFWGSLSTLQARAAGGRFPPVDRLDLKEHGRLMAGRDIRNDTPAPPLKDMVIAAAQQALWSLASHAATLQLRDPASLVEAGARTLTKRILFPVRFMYTAQTGAIGCNDAAVAHFLASRAGPAAELALCAFQWRYAPFQPGDGAVLERTRAGLLPLYRMFVEDYEARLRACGEDPLARSFAQWRSRLGD